MTLSKLSYRVSQRILPLSFFLSLSFLPFSASAQLPEVVLTVGHTEQVSSIDISPDGRFLATGALDKQVKIWDTRTAREIRTLAGNDGRVLRVKFDPTSKYLAVIDYSEKLKIWDVVTGKVMSSFPSDENGESMDFCLDNKGIVFLDLDGNIVVGDYKTGVVMKTYDVENQPVRIKGLPDGKQAIYYDYKGVLHLIDLNTGNEVLKSAVFDKFVYPTSRIVVDRTGKTIAVGFDDNTIRMFDVATLREKKVLRGHDIRLTDICFDETADRLYSSDHDRNLILWDANTGKKIKSFDKTVMGITCLESHPTESMIAYGEYKSVHYIDSESARELKVFAAKGNRILSMGYDQKGKYLATASDDLYIKLWDIPSLRIERMIEGFFPVEFSPLGNEFACMGRSINLAVYNPVDGKLIRNLDTEMELIQNLNYSADGKYLAGAGFQGILRVWDMTTGKVVHKLKGHENGIYSTSFSPDGKYIASCGMDNTVRIWDFKTGKQLKVLEGQTVIIHDVEFSPDGKYLASAAWDKTIYLWNTSDWTLNKKLEGHVNMITTISFSPDGKFLASGAGNNSVAEYDNSIRVWDVNTGQTVCKFENPTGAINKVIYEKGGNLILSAADDGMMKVWDVKKCVQVASLISVNKMDYIIVTPDNYYTASRDALTAVSFRLNDQLFPFEQFDIRLNRPDIVASRIGKTPANLINAFNYVYQKRLKRMNFREEDLGKEFHVPTLTMNKAEIPLVTTASELKFTVKMRDDKFKLDRLTICINDNPVFGPNGYSLSALNSGSVDQEVTINLLPGNNKLNVSCINDKGAESLIEEFGVIRDAKPEKHNLFVVSIGVSKYKDSRFNLNFAAKDAQDMLTKFTSSKDLYLNVYSKLLVDDQATKENISSVSEFLAPAGPEDIVVVFIAGHGVLDEKFEYFFGTHDLDFENPADRGLSYEKIEMLFANLKAQRKLLIMDTCHSGELDKEEVEAASQPEVEIKDVKFRAVGAGLVKKESFGSGNATDLMQMLFTDVKKGTGTMVISSSGGAEFAMESGQWKNGLFTYCFLSASSDFASDLNYDKHLSVSELRKYVYEKVYRLSGGYQKPTTRSENLVLDYFVW